ncbi:MAG: hypothetical protein RRZ64_05495 [Rikenellaceae bacterium]
MTENFVEKINDIVFDTLARRCSVYIEAVGSLMLSSENVLTKVDGKVNSYPYYKVTFVRGERFGIDLKAHCLSISGIDKKNIDTVFSNWLSECGITKSLSNFTINGVVSYDGSVVKMSDGLNKSLNSIYVEPKREKMSISGGGVSIKWISIILIVAIAVTAYFVFFDGADYDILPKAQKEEATPTIINERVVDDTVVEEEADSVTLEEDVAKEPITNEEAFYIVSGVFSTRENAQKHLDGLKNKNKNVVEVLGKFYATIGTYKTDAAATEAKKAAKSDCWVLKVKNNKPIYKEQ